MYFIGKVLWIKGLDKLLDLQKFYQEITGKYLSIDTAAGRSLRGVWGDPSGRSVQFLQLFERLVSPISILNPNDGYLY